MFVASAFVCAGAMGKAASSCKSAAAESEQVSELERLRRENEELKEMQRLRKENEDIRGGLALPKSRFFDRFFSPLSPRTRTTEKQERGAEEERGGGPLALLDEMDELIHSSTSLLGGLMNSMLSADGFELVETKEAQRDVEKVTTAVKLQLQETGELGKSVVVDPPASQSYYKSNVNGKETTQVTLILRAHAEDNTNLSGIVRVHANIDDNGEVLIDRLELNKNLLVDPKDIKVVEDSSSPVEQGEPTTV